MPRTSLAFLALTLAALPARAEETKESPPPKRFPSSLDAMNWWSRPRPRALDAKDEAAFRSFENMFRFLSLVEKTARSRDLSDEEVSKRLLTFQVDPERARIALDYLKRREEAGEPPAVSESGDLEKAMLDWLEKTNLDARLPSPGDTGTPEPAPETPAGEIPTNADHLEPQGLEGEGPMAEFEGKVSRYLGEGIEGLIEDFRAEGLGGGPGGAKGDAAWNDRVLERLGGRMGSFFDRASSFSIEPPRFGGGGGSFGGLPDGVLAAGVLLVLVVAALLLWKGRAFSRLTREIRERARTIRLRYPGRIRGRDDVIAAFHALASAVLGSAAIPRSHLELERELVARFPEAATELGRLTAIYAWCRYAWSSWVLDEAARAEVAALVKRLGARATEKRRA